MGFRVWIGVIYGLYRDYGKENGSYHSILGVLFLSSRGYNTRI